MDYRTDARRVIKTLMIMLLVFGVVFVVLPLAYYLMVPETTSVLSIEMPDKGEALRALIGNAAGFLVIGAVLAFSAWFGIKSNRRFQAVLDEDAPEPAFDRSLDIEIDVETPEHLAPLVGKVREIVVMRNTFGSAGGETGETLHTRFSSFAIDVNGATHDIRTHHHHHVVDDHAKKLAAILGCPHKDTSYG